MAQQDDEGVPPVPIGVRQLEALVRLSESFARMALCREAGEAHVDLAMDLFNRSTMNAMEAGVTEPSTLNRQVRLGGWGWQGRMGAPLGSQGAKAAQRRHATLLPFQQPSCGVAQTSGAGRGGAYPAGCSCR